MICCICKQEINGIGHNPAPFPTEWEEERCCDICNYGVVLPLRLKEIEKLSKKEEDENK